MNGRQFIYHMQGLTKSYPPAKKVLDNINLSFYPDAKIGVLGVNGSGKSTLLKIMAGIDTEYSGEGWVAQGARVGYLEQEPQLDPNKSVRGNVEVGVGAKRALLDRYNEIAMNYSEENADEMAKLQDIIDSQDLWDLDSKVTQAMDALNCPPDDADIAKLSGGERRRVALCRLLLEQPELLLLDEPTNHLDAESVNWLEGHLRNYPGAILIVTHDRYFLDNVTGWILELDHGRGIPYEGNYTSWLTQKQKRMEQEGREDEARRRALEREQEWVQSSPKARQAKSKARYERYEELLKVANAKVNNVAQITIPVVERLGNNVVDFEHLTKGFGDKLLIDDLDVPAAAGRHRRRHRPERRRQDHAVPHDHRPGKARRRHHQGRRERASRLCRPVARYARWQEKRLGGNLRRQRHHAGRQAGSELARLCVAVQLQGRRSAEEGRHALGRRAQPRALGEDAEIRRQPAAARRTDQRSRRRHVARARGSAWRISPAAP